MKFNWIDIKQYRLKITIYHQNKPINFVCVIQARIAENGKCLAYIYSLINNKINNNIDAKIEKILYKISNEEIIFIDFIKNYKTIINDFFDTNEVELFEFNESQLLFNSELINDIYILKLNQKTKDGDFEARCGLKNELNSYLICKLNDFDKCKLAAEVFVNKEKEQLFS